MTPIIFLALFLAFVALSIEQGDGGREERAMPEQSPI